MAVPLVLVVLPLGLLFLLSGLIVNTIQAILFVTIRPFSKSFYRRINRFLAELLWLQLVWVVDWWAGVKVQLHADEETYRSMGKEHALIISNHRSDIDWLIGWILAQRSGCLGSALAVMKKSSKFLPWGLQRLKDFPRPFWLALFVEVPALLQQSFSQLRVCSFQDLPAPRNVLIPRTKDALLDKHLATGTFDEEIRPIGRPVKSLLVTLFWSFLLLFGAIKFFQWTQLLSTWRCSIHCCRDGTCDRGSCMSSSCSPRLVVELSQRLTLKRSRRNENGELEMRCWGLLWPSFKRVAD
ncbi:unnamed protein product [Miscanthus lutarioriparius]|uniref:1-acylglycerol-3-phosphate O-acyltransferase n=1 Tax=Miscanthus lutarioriparius TaxID=422564 RepID=A0A811QA77_9POAL|nr:unnamed protein product [Miscanthus lutarioriparius]